MKKPTETELKVMNTLIEGLFVDGGHHKQYCIEKALSLITGEPIENIRKNVRHEPGIRD